jgi:hypothetical protein
MYTEPSTCRAKAHTYNATCTLHSAMQVLVYALVQRAKVWHGYCNGLCPCAHPPVLQHTTGLQRLPWLLLA